MPSNYDVEEIFKLYNPYKSEEGVVDETNIAEQWDYFKTEEFYIEKIAIRMELNIPLHRLNIKIL